MSQLVNITLKLKGAEQSHHFEAYLRDMFFENEVVSYRNIADTDKMYENDKHFKKIVKDIKKLQDIRDNYINDNNYKFEKL